MVEDGGFLLRELFKKKLTRSDIAISLGRLVIPKKHAEEYLPKVTKVDAKDNVVEDNSVMLRFLERQRQRQQLWVFKYCYWSSSKSYVFIKGWSHFVMDNHLQANDLIKFYECENQGEDKERYLMIEIVRCGGNGGGVGKEEEMVEGERVGNGRIMRCKQQVEEEGVTIVKRPTQGQEEVVVDLMEVEEGERDVKKDGVWVFGVRIG